MFPEALQRKPDLPAAGGWHGLHLSAAVGRGRTAEVWRAQSAQASAVAVKLPALSFSAAEAMVLMRAEAQLLAQFSHPHIVRLLGVIAPGEAQYADGVPEQRPGIVLELLEGGDLVGLAGLPLQHWREAALAVLDALEYLHDEGYVHGDVKARNVMFAADGGVRLVDFASCRPRGFFCMGPIGTPLQQRPRSNGHIVSEDDDVFAFTALLYELLAGRPAFTDERSKCEQRPMPLERLNRQVTPDERVLESTVLAMLTSRRRLDRSDAKRLRAALSVEAAPVTDE
jgi:serine/threonine protein kinase